MIQFWSVPLGRLVLRIQVANTFPIYNRVAAGSRAWHRLIECVNHLAHNFRFVSNILGARVSLGQVPERYRTTIHAHTNHSPNLANTLGFEQLIAKVLVRIDRASGRQGGDSCSIAKCFSKSSTSLLYRRPRLRGFGWNCNARWIRNKKIHQPELFGLRVNLLRQREMVAQSCRSVGRVITFISAHFYVDSL